MSLPTGTLVLSRVVGDPGDALATALDRELTGYAVLEPQDALLLDGMGEGRLTFEDGVPVAAHHTGSGRRGADALADLAVPGPYRVELRSIPVEALDEYHGESDRRVAADAPADLLAGDSELADRTRAAAPATAPPTRARWTRSRRFLTTRRRSTRSASAPARRPASAPNSGDSTGIWSD
jgi:hypothetical protein